MRRSAVLPLVIQALVSAVLILLLVRRVPIRDTLAAMGRLRPSTVAFATGLALAAYAGRAQRWVALLRHADVSVGALRAYCLTLAGVGYGLVTPGKVGEFGRALHIGGSKSRAFASVVRDRFTDVLLLEALSIPAFVLVPSWRGPVLALFLAVVGATLAVILLVESPAARRLAARWLPFASRALGRWDDASGGSSLRGAFAAGFAGGCFYYALNFAASWLLLRDLAPGAPAKLVLAFPIIPLLGNLPIAFSGLGLREQVSASLFRDAGASIAAGPAFSLLVFTIATLLPGLAGLLLAATPWARATERPA